MTGSAHFLSYNGTDRPAVLAVRQRLEAAGLHTFLDQDLRLGREWLPSLQEWLLQAVAVVVFLGPAGMSRWQWSEVYLALERQTRNPDLPVIPVLLPGCEDLSPAFLFRNTWLDLRSGLEGPAIDRLVSALRGERPAEDGARETAVCPFRGLEPFREEDAAFFFGRAAFIDRLVERVRDHRLVAVVGSSGSGKSSVVQAGLIPRLRRQREPFWEILSLHPGDDPYDQLAKTFYPVLEPEAGEVQRLRETEELAADLRDRRTPLVSALERILAKSAGSQRLLLVIDQLEELFTADRVDRSRARTLVEDLLAARESLRPHLTLVLTLRADFYGHALTLSRQLSDQVESRVVNLGPMSPDERWKAIEKPAERVHLRFEPYLIERILEQVQGEPGELPLLEYALRELWVRRSIGNELTHQAFEQIGGVRGAISRRADEEFGQLSAEQQRAARRLLLSMVRVPDLRREERHTRRQVVLSEPSRAERRVIESLAKAKLLVISSTLVDETSAVTLAHEALIEQWGRLRTWLDEDAEFLRWQQRVRTDYEEWKEKERSSDFLLPEARLAEVERWLHERGDELEDKGLKTFLKESQKAWIWRARRRMAFFVLLLGVAVIAIFGWWRAEVQERAAVARQLTAQAELVSGDRGNQLDLGVLLGVEALRRFQDLGMASLEADQVLRRGLTLLPLPITPVLKHEDQGRLLCLAFSRDGRVLATAGQDGTARLWDTSTGREMGRARHNAFVSAVAFSPDGRILATAGQDGTARLWRDGRETVPALVHRGALTALAFSPDGAFLATASVDRTARVWETASGREVARFPHGDQVSSVAFARDGQSILTASLDHTARVWEIATRRQALRLPHAGAVLTALFSPDGRSIATACEDGTASVWDGATARRLAWLSHNQTASEVSAVSAVAFHPQGGFLATGGRDGTARLWDLKTGRERERLSHRGPLTAVAFSPDGESLGTASNDKTARLWDTGTGRELSRVAHQGIVYAIAFRPDGSAFATASFDKTARIWRTPASSRLGPLLHKYWVRDVAFDPASGSLVTASFNGTIRLWSPPAHNAPAAGWTLARPFDHSSAVLSAAVSPDGRWIASGGSDGSARLWDLSTGRKADWFPHGNGIEAISFHPDRQRLATASHDRTVRLWGVAKRELLATLHHRGAVYDVAFTPDGKLLATASQDRLLRLWRTDGGQLLQRLPQSHVLRAVAFDPGGELLAIGGDDASLRVWKVERERLTEGRVLTSSAPGMIYDLAFSPRGKYLASAGGDGAVRLWDLATGEQVSQMRHDESVYALAFSPDGKYLATASDDHTVRIWPVLPQDLIAEACVRVSPRFTPENWSRFFGAAPFHEICP